MSASPRSHRKLLIETSLCPSLKASCWRRISRDLIYALKDQGRLDVKDLAPAVRGERSPIREVRAIAEYIVPRKVETEAEYKAKHDRRRLATKPSGYKNLALAAARFRRHGSARSDHEACSRVVFLARCDRSRRGRSAGGDPGSSRAR